MQQDQIQIDHNKIPDSVSSRALVKGILITDDQATMSALCFGALENSTYNNPTPAWAGRVWKRYHYLEKRWYLCWYKPGEKYWDIHERPIVVFDWQSLMGALPT